jgi:hypothetical protein
LTGSFFAPAQPQNLANEEKPTFYRLVPGTYVNGWPRFTIHYPRDWVERRTPPQEIFRASVPGVPGSFRFPAFMVAVAHNPDPLEKMAATLVMVFRMMSTDVALVSDKLVRLRDGSPAQEIEIRWVRGGVPLYWFGVATKKGDTLILTGATAMNEEVGEALKAIPYSIEFDPGKDEPVKLPPDIQEFLDKHNNDLISHDVAKFMSHYSDRFLNSGDKKGEIERMWNKFIGLVTSAQVVITEFVPAGDRTYLAGIGITNLRKGMLTETSIIKENGEWKWYGNQRDPAP